VTEGKFDDYKTRHSPQSLFRDPALAPYSPVDLKHDTCGKQPVWEANTQILSFTNMLLPILSAVAMAVASATATATSDISPLFFLSSTALYV